MPKYKTIKLPKPKNCGNQPAIQAPKVKASRKYNWYKIKQRKAKEAKSQAAKQPLTHRILAIWMTLYYWLWNSFCLVKKKLRESFKLLKYGKRKSKYSNNHHRFLIQRRLERRTNRRMPI